jgi:hypothetical protein
MGLWAAGQGILVKQKYKTKVDEIRLHFGTERL